MITPEYCQLQARYNAWQNKWIRGVVEDMSDADLREDRGAFFGSIFGTLNHILWADMIWFYRLGLGDKPAVEAKDHKETTPTIAVWGAERFKMDGKISEWARNVKAVDLTGEVVWRSALKDVDMVNGRAACIMHLFNHQTHHRGQVHAMLTGAGKQTQDTDLLFMDM